MTADLIRHICNIRLMTHNDSLQRIASRQTIRYQVVTITRCAEDPPEALTSEYRNKRTPRAATGGR